jgi:hypothetical protein
MRIFFATDLHGSTQCFKKFLAAKDFYQCDHLILGGDLTAKAVVPIQASDGRVTYKLFGRAFSADSDAELHAAEERIRNAGFYPLVRRLHPGGQPPADMSREFDILIEEQVLAWDRMAVEKDVTIHVIPGNDDNLEMDVVLQRCMALVNCDRKTLELGEGWTISGLGGSNRTPWDTPREYSEEELTEALAVLIASVPDRTRSIFNIHVPPYGSGLDIAEAIDENFRLVARLGQAETLPVGSSAVRAFIEKSRIPLALHGHVHDSRGWKRIGATLCINPGSEYFVGVLDGCIVELNPSGIAQFQLTRG